MEPKNNRTALYLRLSKEDADKTSKEAESVSIQNQRLLLTEYAKRHNFQIVAEYADDDESGLYEERPGFQRLLTDAKQGLFSTILAKSQSRFSRNMEHVEHYLHDEFPKYGIRFIGVTDGTDTAQEHLKKARQVSSLVNEWYCEDLSKNIRSVFQAKMRKGEYLGASCPYGYQKDPADPHRLLVDPYAADVVRRIFSLYQNGYGKKKIASLLSKDGISIPTRYKQEVQKLPYQNAHLLPQTVAWSAQTIHHILNNPVYLGNMVQHRTEKCSYKEKTCRSIPKEDWIVVEHTHPAVITKEQYNLVQMLQKTRSRPVQRQEGSDFFQGKLLCADCGKKLCRTYQRHGTHAFIGYICRTYHSCGKQFCTRHYIPYPVLVQCVEKALQETLHTLTKTQRKRLFDHAMQSASVRFQKKETKARVTQELAQAKRYRDGMLELYLDGILSREECVSRQEEYEKRVEQLTQKQASLQIEQEKQNVKKEQYKSWILKFLQGELTDSLDMNVISHLIEQIEVYENGSLQIHFTFAKNDPICYDSI